MKRYSKKYEEIRYDEHAQEILQGCNTFVEVKYNNEKNKIKEQFNRKQSILKKKQKRFMMTLKKDNNNGNAIYIIENDNRFLYFPKDECIFILYSDGSQKTMERMATLRNHERINGLPFRALRNKRRIRNQKKKAESDRLFKIECEKREEERKTPRNDKQKFEYQTQKQKDIENINKNSRYCCYTSRKNQKTFKVLNGHLK